MKETAMNDLRINVVANKGRYHLFDPWLEVYFKGASWCLQSNIRIESEIELVQPKSPTEHYDLENTKIVYSAFKHLTVTQATEERLWTYLSHTTFWKYMRMRWPVEDYTENERFVDNMRERYFFMSQRDRALIRNGIARLWWYGYVSYDESRADPFELTRILLKNLDIAESLLGRSFSRNRTLTMTVLQVLEELEKKSKPFFHREKFRTLMKHINQIGGVTVLDVLDSPDIERVVIRKIEQLIKA